ncbi:hypothetical protein [Actinotalea sp. C106]|uniref:hypothetical protein n=1 Tax=Actinotalea sp. C106 TaxID=2908644 RepID=UPI0035ABFB84
MSVDHPVSLPHPRTRQLFGSPVPPDAGWPGDLADGTTPVATSADQVARIAGTSDAMSQVDAASTVCRACPRLVSWREEVAVTRRRAFRDQPYWGRPAAGFGDPDARLLVVGLAPATR